MSLVMKHIHAFGVRAKISCIDFLYAWCYNQEARISVVKFCLAGGYGGIGRRDRFRFYCQQTCRFESCYPHEKINRRISYRRGQIRFFI